MKNINIFFALIYMLTSTLLFSQDLFQKYNPSIETYNKIIENIHDIEISNIKKNIIFYEIDTNIVSHVMDNEISFLNYSLPFFENEIISLNMEIQHHNTINLTRHTQSGIINEYHDSKIKTYKIKNEKEDIQGVFIFSENGVKAVFSKNNETYQIDMFNQKHNQNTICFIVDINKSIIDFDFSCSHDLLDQIPDQIDYSNYRSGSSFGCLDIAIEIDYYTFQTFNNYQDAIDWALEMIVVAQSIYLQELDLNLISTSAQIWEISDPYLDFVNDPQNMLIAIRDNWMNNQDFQNINRDLVHLFSKRSNTGTGGIAFLNGVGSDWSGYGFSSNLVDVEEYVDLPVPYFFWNIYCLVHELGHNLGAKHTQWCGWPDGPIDNCSNIEELSVGECQNYTNNPSPEVGTIMSYCHTWSFQSGGGIILKFHDYVKESIIAYLGFQDLYDCQNIDEVFGCTDVNACNYDDLANTDDSSCLYAELNLDCDGNCLNDENQNSICDEYEFLSIGTEISDDRLVIFPNPTSNFITVRTDNLSLNQVDLDLYNSSGQLVLELNKIANNTKIDISNMSAGLYNAHLIFEQELERQTIIIQ